MPGRIPTFSANAPTARPKKLHPGQQATGGWRNHGDFSHSHFGGIHTDNQPTDLLFKEEMSKL